MNSIARFLTRGDLGPLKIGMPDAESASILGVPNKIGKGIAGSRLQAFGRRSLQITHKDERLILIAVYFESAETVDWPRKLGVEMPFSKTTTMEQFREYLDEHGIPWQPGILPNSDGQMSLRVGENVTACFEDGLLRSLQAKAVS